MNLWRVLASGAGIGYAPKAPGTFGALVGLFAGATLLAAGHLALLVSTIMVAGLGIIGIRKSGDAASDPGWIVIDEIAGQMLTLLALSHSSTLGLTLAFGLFRLFDIWKPGPVGWADAIHDEWGVMGDDLIAGVLALAVLLLLRIVLPL